MTNGNNTIETKLAQQNVWERRFQTFVGVILLTLMLWLFDTVSKQTVEIAVQATNVGNLTKRFDMMASLFVTNPYMSTNAVRDRDARDREIETLKQEMESLRLFVRGRGPG